MGVALFGHIVIVALKLWKKDITPNTDMGNCCGSRSNTVAEGDPEPTPQPIPLGTTNAAIIDIVYYEDPSPAAVSSYALTDSPVATFDCAKATQQIQEVSLTIMTTTCINTIYYIKPTLVCFYLLTCCPINCANNVCFDSY